MAAAPATAPAAKDVPELSQEANKTILIFKCKVIYIYIENALTLLWWSIDLNLYCHQMMQFLFPFQVQLYLVLFYHRVLVHSQKMMPTLCHKE
jgi:hypothetical protein